jgi:pyruvate,water dikinase
VPLALVLGPMCMSFMWLTDRLDPASWNTEPGRKAFIKATVDSEFRGELLLSVPAPLMLDGNSRTRTLTPPVRETLESLAEYWWDTPTDLSNLPWELQAAAMAAREHMVGDLNSYLKQGVPDEKLSWTIRSPVDANGHYTVELAAIAPAKATSQPASAPASGGSAGKLASVVCDWQARQACLPKGKAASQPATSPSTDGCTVSRARAVLVYGNAAPPVACPIGGDDSGPIKSLELAWDVPPERKFWTPFASLGWQWDTGWLLIYLAVYVPAMFLVRWVLGVA